MFTHPFFSSQWPVSCLLAGALLALPAQPTRAQSAAPAPAESWAQPNALLYLDGKPSTLAEVGQLADDAIQSVGGMELHGADSMSWPGSNVMAQSIEFIVTKANANSPAVLALADQFDLSEGYTEQPATVRAIAPKALAYITRHYPQAWLDGKVTTRTKKTTGAVRYQVQLADRWGWHYVDFTAAGEVVEHPMATPAAMSLALTLRHPHAVVSTSLRRYAPIYLDGQRVSPEILRALDPDSLARVVTLTADVAPLLTPEAAGLGLLFVTTKQGQQQPTTIAFNERIEQLAIIHRLAAHSHHASPTAPAPLVPTQPAAEAAGIRYYLDNKPVDQETVEKLNPDTIASVGILGAEYPHGPTVQGLVALKTKQLSPIAADSSRRPRKRVN